jgi:colicin import membrane protein
LREEQEKARRRELDRKKVAEEKKRKEKERQEKPKEPPKREKPKKEEKPPKEEPKKEEPKPEPPVAKEKTPEQLEQERLNREQTAREKVAAQEAQERQGAERKAQTAGKGRTEGEGKSNKSVSKTSADKIKSRIKGKVEGFWVRPAGSTEQGLACTMEIRLIPGGAVGSVSVTQSSGNPAFDRSAIAAVRAASPFPVPSDVFDEFRRPFYLHFNPKGQ